MFDKISKNNAEIKQNRAKDTRTQDHTRLQTQLSDQQKQTRDHRDQLSGEYLQYQKTAETLHKSYQTLSKSIEVAKKTTLSPDLIDNYNFVIGLFNKRRDRFVAFNREIQQHTPTQPEGIPQVELLTLPRRLQPLKETPGQSESSFNAGKLFKTVAMGYLALSSSLLVDARPSNTLAEISRNSSLWQPTHWDQSARLSKIQGKEMSISTIMKHRRLVQHDMTYGNLLITQTENANIYASDKSDNTINAAQIIAQTVETDNAYLTNIFLVGSSQRGFLSRSMCNQV